MAPRKSARKAGAAKAGLRQGQFRHPGLELNRDFTVSATEYKVGLFGFVHWKREWPESFGDKTILFRPWPHDSLFTDFIGVEPYYYEEGNAGARASGSVRYLRGVEQFLAYFRCAFLRVLHD